MAYNKDLDRYPGSSPRMDTFGKSSREVTPSDTDDFSPYAKAVVCATAGNIAVLPVQNADDEPVAFEDVPAGFIPPFHVRRVMATGTTATVHTVDN